MSQAGDIDFIHADRARIEAHSLAVSLYALFAQTAQTHADKPFWISIEEGGKAVSYGAFRGLVERYAAALGAFGVARGMHVAVTMHNSADLGAVWLALSRLGAVAIGVNTGLTDRELRYVLSTSDAVVLIADADALPPSPEEQGELPVADERVIVRGGVPARGQHRWDDVMAVSASAPKPADVDPDELASMLFTSGSTGFPKACMLPHRWHTMMGWVRSQQGPPVERILVDTPFYYMGGQWRFGMALSMGAALCVARKPSLSRYLDRLLDFGIGFCSASSLTAKLPDDPRYELLRLGWVASTGLPRELHEPLERRLRAPVREIYGSTELGSTIVMPAGVTSMVGSGSCGMPGAWRSCKIVDETGREVRRGEPGELLVRGPGILIGYYNRPDANAESFRDGWFRTGDLFVQDGDGYYYWRSRIKNIIRRSSQNISADEVEAVVRELPAVVEAAAIPVADEYRGEEVKIYVSLLPGLSEQDLPPQRIVQHCRNMLAAYKIPRYIEYVTEFPRTASNKISRQKLRVMKPDLRSGSYDTQDEIWRPRD